VGLSWNSAARDLPGRYSRSLNQIIAAARRWAGGASSSGDSGEHQVRIAQPVATGLAVAIPFFTRVAHGLARPTFERRERRQSEKRRARGDRGVGDRDPRRAHEDELPGAAFFRAAEIGGRTGYAPRT